MIHQKPPHRILIPALLLVAPFSPAERVEIRLEQETSFGESLFASAPHPLLGGGDITKSVKLSALEYPVWSLTLDLPEGVEIEPSIFLRADDPEMLSDPANGSPVSAAPVLNTGPAGAESSRHLVFLPRDAGDLEVLVIDPAGVTDHPNLHVALAGETPEEKRYSFLIDPSMAARWLEIDLVVDGESITEEPVRLHRGDVWWRHGEAFLYPPPDEELSPPRREEFTFAPGDPTFDARTVRIQLPRGYEDHPAKHYPVLYAQDGQNVFSPGGAFGSWDLDVTIPELVSRGEMPEAILVGIDNTADRLREYRPEYTSLGGVPGRGRAFLTMLRNELMPEIDSRYRTLAGPRETLHIGSSLGGVLGFQAAEEFDGVFGCVIAMSPSFWLNPGEFQRRASQPPESFARLWIDSGTSGIGGNDGFWDTMTVRDTFLDNGHALGPGFFHTVGLGQEHNEAAWRERSPEALRWAYRPRLARDEALKTTWILSGAAGGEH